MEHLNKLLFHIENSPQLFKQKYIGFILGLTNSQIKDLKKAAISEGFIVEKQKQFFLSNAGKHYLNLHPFEPSGINLEYLKLEKAPATVTKAIRALARHLLDDYMLKSYSIEAFIQEELLGANSKYKDVQKEIENYLKQGKRINLSDLYNQFLAKGLTKSVISVLLLNVFAQNKNKFAVYEKYQFVLTINQLLFDKMMIAPQNFELQYTVITEAFLLEDLSILFLPQKTTNLLDITRGLIHFIKNLDKYTLETGRLSNKAVKLRNTVINSKDPVNLFMIDIPRIIQGKKLPDCDKSFVEEFTSVINELKNSTENMIKEIEEFTLKTFNAKTKEELVERFETISELIGNKEMQVFYKNVVDKNVSNRLWIERIATYTNKKRVPKDWTDEDIADFKVKLKELAIKFSVIESLTGEITLVFDDKLSNLFKQFIKLTQAEKNILLRRIINV